MPRPWRHHVVRRSLAPERFARGIVRVTWGEVMRLILAVMLLAVAGWANAADVQYTRGDFSFSVGAEPDFVIRRELPETWSMQTTGDDGQWRYWLYDVQVDRRTGHDQLYVEQVYEPRSTATLGDAGRFQVSFIPEYQQLTFHKVELRRDGVWQDRLLPDKISLVRRESEFERNIANGAVTALVVLDDVRTGDVVRISYSIQGSNPILAGQISDWMKTGWGSPLLDVSMRVLEDPGTKVRFYREHDAPRPTVGHGAEATVVSVHDHAVAPVLDEGDYPLWYQPYPSVQIAVDQSWADVVDWALPLYPKVEALPASLLARIEQWRQLSDPHDRLRAALRAVQDEVRYFGVEMGVNTHRPVAPAETWSRRYGDCKDKAYLLVTVLDRLGIKAVPALVSTSRGRAIVDFVPSASVFDHVVVRAKIGDEVLWLDPTISQQGGDPSHSALGRYGFALPVARGVQDLQAIESTQADESGIQVKERYVPRPSGEVELAIETVYRGSSADYARRTLLNERVDEISRRYASYYGRRFGELSVLEPPRVDDDRPRNVVKVFEHYLLADPFDEEGLRQTLEVHAEALSGGAEMPTIVQREGPLGYLFTKYYRHRIEFEIPEAWIPTFAAGSVEHSSPAFAYSRSVEIDDRSAILVHDLAVKQSELTAQQAPEHIRAVRALQDSLWATLRFDVPQSLDESERQQRLRTLLRGVMDDANNSGDPNEKAM